MSYQEITDEMDSWTEEIEENDKEKKKDENNFSFRFHQGSHGISWYDPTNFDLTYLRRNAKLPKTYEGKKTDGYWTSK